MPPPCHPCLPLDLLEKLKSEADIFIEDSTIFQPNHEQFRLGVVKHGNEQTPIELEVVIEKDKSKPRVAIEGPSRPRSNAVDGLPKSHERLSNITSELGRFRKGDQKTLLHYAAIYADLALAYELIRMGIKVDHKDRNGTTALLACLILLASYSSTLIVVSLPRFPKLPPCFPGAEAMEPIRIKKKIKCMERIATLIIEQQADVNVEAHGYTPILLAAEAGQEKLVELLLRHGARRPRLDEITFQSPVNKSLYRSIISKTKAADPRPPRPCPCWSGKLLSECHENQQIPYPDHFLCGCGRKRVYGQCCGKRGIIIIETWEPFAKWITTAVLREIPPPSGEQLVCPEAQPYIQDGMMAHLGVIASMDASTFAEVSARMQKNKVPYIKGMLETVGKAEEVDDAWWFAMGKNDFIPRPWGHVMSKVECRKRVNEWNGSVDEYIATQGDPRDRLEIEIEAKITVDGGPLYKMCLAENCGAKEKLDVPTLRKCAGCGIATYCSKECQARSWKEEGHKKECQNGKVMAQRSGSQWTLEQLFTTMQAMDGMAAAGRIDELLQPVTSTQTQGGTVVDMETVD